MKNRDENTTIIQLSYRIFTIIERFFKDFLAGLIKITHVGEFVKTL